MDSERTFDESLHPQTAKWFRKTFRKPTEAQELCLPDIAVKRSVLLSSPTGSGKTLAGFLGGFAKYAVFAVAVVTVLGQFGIQTASLLAVLDYEGT